MPFASLHNVIARLVNGDAVDDFLTTMQANGTPQGQLAAKIAQQFTTFATAGTTGGDYSGLLAEAAMLGGSNAQRDLLVDTAISDALRSGESALARELTDARASARAKHLDERWFERLISVRA